MNENRSLDETVSSARNECLSGQEGGNDLLPFRVERQHAVRLTGLSVPVAGVPFVAFLAMEVGVHPGCIRSVFRLRDFVRLVPVAFGLPPEGVEEGREGWWRLLLTDGCAEFDESHAEDCSFGLASDALHGFFGNLE